MNHLISLFGGIIYHKVPFYYYGISSGSKMNPDKLSDYIPDKMTHIHEMELN